MKKNLGNFLIIMSLLLFTYIYYPIIQAYLFPGSLLDPNIEEAPYKIQIPKIGAYAKIIENVDPWNETEYRSALKKGVAEAVGFSNFFFAHSSGNPWELSRYNTIFLRLGELRSGDEIIIYKNKEKTRYLVRETKVVWPSEVEYLLKSKESNLILQTCTPLGTSLKRLLVFARPAKGGTKVAPSEND